MVLVGGSMISKTLSEAQDYLTMEKEDGHKHIINIEELMTRHSLKEIIEFLKDYRKDKENALNNLMLIDKTQRRVDQYVATIFRIYMAIKTLEGEEVVQSEKSKRRTTKSGKLHNRNSGSRNRTGSRQNRSYDAAHRSPGDETQRAA